MQVILTQGSDEMPSGFFFSKHSSGFPSELLTCYFFRFLSTRAELIKEKVITHVVIEWVIFPLRERNINWTMTNGVCHAEPSEVRQRFVRSFGSVGVFGQEAPE